MSDVYVGGVKSALALDARPWLDSLTEGLKGIDQFYVKAAALFTKTDKAGEKMGESFKKTFGGDMGLGKFGDAVQKFGTKVQSGFQQVVQISQTTSARFKQAFTPDTANGLTQTGVKVQTFQQQFSAAAKAYAADVKSFNDSSKEWSKQVRQMGTVLAGSGATITAGLALAGKRYLDFDRSMRNTNSIAKKTPDSIPASRATNSPPRCNSPHQKRSTSAKKPTR